MKYLKLIGINFKYILSKQSIFFLSISFGILLVSFFFNTNFLSNTSSKILYEKEYYYSYVTGSYNVLIAIFGLLSVFLSIMFSNSYDLYLISRCKRIEIIIQSKLADKIIYFCCILPRNNACLNRGYCRRQG